MAVACVIHVHEQSGFLPDQYQFAVVPRPGDIIRLDNDLPEAHVVLRVDHYGIKVGDDPEGLQTRISVRLSDKTERSA